MDTVHGEYQIRCFICVVRRLERLCGNHMSEAKDIGPGHMDHDPTVI